MPGAPTRFDVDLGPVAIDLPAGHALRVSIAGTSSPRYEPNPGTSAPLSSNPAPTPSTLTVYRDTSHPSVIVLPVTSGALPGEVILPPEPTDEAAAAEEAGPADEATGQDDVAMGDRGSADADAAQGDVAADVDADSAATDPPPCGCSGSGCAAGSRPDAFPTLPVAILLLVPFALAGACRRRERATING